jgi:hypothetical protein
MDPYFLPEGASAPSYVFFNYMLLRRRYCITLRALNTRSSAVLLRVPGDFTVIFCGSAFFRYESLLFPIVSVILNTLYLRKVG